MGCGASKRTELAALAAATVAERDATHNAFDIAAAEKLVTAEDREVIMHSSVQELLHYLETGRFTSLQITATFVIRAYHVGYVLGGSTEEFFEEALERARVSRETEELRSERSCRRPISKPRNHSPV